jgi:ABC-2 type transport system ATP-binding protein
MIPALKINNLTKDYASIRAVDDVSFSVNPGEIFGLLGPNGAGKTSIISMITTVEQPTSGQIEVFGENVGIDCKRSKFLTGVVPQELINHGFFNVEEIMQIHSGYFGLTRNQKRIDMLLKRLGLWDCRHQKVKELSGGMKRRLLIAKSLVHSPKLLLLDEPTAGVDIELRASLWKFTRELREDGMAILLTTHYLEEAEELCDRVGILNFGKLKKVDQTQDLVKELTHRQVVFLLAHPSPKIEHPQLISQSELQLVFRLPSSLEVGDLMRAVKLDSHAIRDIKIREGTLEDAFQNIVGDHYE